ncbi:hypothetical protein [Colwellia polaris]|jgi:hypothetical protein|uniref:hypothetical protein n=1 Tax=Colwellia polaris TaxID=326537 RepID=UPI000A16F7F0|nr:hypothetical protein [Colwellia polaris]|tara:strand:+ start:3799 stop:4266 length:468 start_codon:yes stop_codon:yes gene_type:complete
MKYLIGLIFCLMIQVSFAKESLPKDCSHLQTAMEADFVLLSKKEFIELGECLAVNLIKKRTPLNVVESCNEVDEDRRNLLGIFSLSKLEAILIGQCMGTINYIYEHYDNEPVLSYNYQTKIYQCTKGVQAVDILRQSRAKSYSRTVLRDLLCRER